MSAGFYRWGLGAVRRATHAVVRLYKIGQEEREDVYDFLVPRGFS